MKIPYIRLRKGYDLLPFDCGDKDLNEFLMKDASYYQRGRFAVGTKYQNSDEHWGTSTMNFIKEWMISDNKKGVDLSKLID